MRTHPPACDQPSLRSRNHPPSCDQSATGLTVKPGKPAFRRQLQRIASRNPHNFESIKQALKTSARAIVGEFYDHVEAQAIGAVKLALDASVVDGPPEKRTDAVDKLKKDARPIWEKLLSPIWE